ncbi:MAG: tetratricopeptide repeat protein, partial [Ktedonobacteraceae bacterium]
MQAAELSPRPRLRLTEARMQHSWSQQEVADRIGTTHVNVSRWERGITRPNPYFRRKLCALFGRSEEELELVPPPPQELETPPIVSRPTSDSANAVYDPTIPLLPAKQLVGRERELAQIRQRLCAGGSVALTALNGLPGVGKTALSITLAHDPAIRAHFRDGVLWAGLGPHPNIPSHLSRWGTLLGISATELATMTAMASVTTPASTEAWAKALHAAIGSRSLLVVIDDAWLLEEALACQIGGPNCAHLVTTRFPTIAAHVTIDGATVIQELGKNESMTLLRLLAPGVIDREEQKAADLVQAVGGLPLALTLMGNYLRKQGYSGQPRRILTALQRLSHAEERLQLTEAHAPVASHPSLSPDISLSLQSVIAVTDQQLTAQPRAALYALSVFPPKPDSFSEEAALAVADCTLATLDLLSDTGLLESSGAGRYTLHQTIADYARLHLKDQQEQSAYDRLIRYALDYIEAHKKDYELLALENTVILAALEAAHKSGRSAEVVRGVNAFAPFLLVRGLYTLAEQHLQRALQAAQALQDNYGIAGIQLYLGEIAQKQGDYSKAEKYFQEGLTLARQIKDAERISALLNDLGWVHWKQGNYTQAETSLQEGLRLARQRDDRERISSLLQVLGSLSASHG